VPAPPNTLPASHKTMPASHKATHKSSSPIMHRSKTVAKSLSLEQTTDTLLKPSHTNKQDKDFTIGNGQLLSDIVTTEGKSINPCQQDSTHPCVASMDSGHSLISGPPELVRQLKQYTMPKGSCSDESTASLPDVSFVIGGKLFTLTPTDYLIELEGQCTPAFRERPFRNGHDWVLGEHFMRTFYSVFDYDDMRVGLSRVDTIKDHLSTILNPNSKKEEIPSAAAATPNSTETSSGAEAASGGDDSVDTPSAVSPSGVEAMSGGDDSSDTKENVSEMSASILASTGDSDDSADAKNTLSEISPSVLAATDDFLDDSADTKESAVASVSSVADDDNTPSAPIAGLVMDGLVEDSSKDPLLEDPDLL